MGGSTIYIYLDIAYVVTRNHIWISLVTQHGGPWRWQETTKLQGSKVQVASLPQMNHLNSFDMSNNGFLPSGKLT